MAWFGKKQKKVPSWASDMPDRASFDRWVKLVLRSFEAADIAVSTAEVQSGSVQFADNEIALHELAERCAAERDQGEWLEIVATEMQALLGLSAQQESAAAPQRDEDSGQVDAVLTIWEQMLPVSRGVNYEKPLAEFLAKSGCGEVTGAGTQLSDKREIDYIELQFTIDDSEDTLMSVADLLCEHGIPKNSRIVVYRADEEVELIFGMTEGISLTMANAPSQDAVDRLIQRLRAVVAPASLDYRGAQVVRDTELMLQFYGLDAEELWSAIMPTLAAEPFCKGARAVLRCGHEAGQPRETTISVA